MKSIASLGLVLMIVSASAATALGITFSLTRDRIEQQAREKEAEAFKLVMPDAKDIDDFRENRDLTERFSGAEDTEDVKKVVEASLGDGGKGWVIVVWPKGYGGFVKMAVGIDPDGTVIDFAVIEHAETPGMGDEAIAGVTKQVRGQGIKANDDVEVGKDIDAVSGATVTARAVTKGVRQALNVTAELE